MNRLFNTAKWARFAGFQIVKFNMVLWKGEMDMMLINWVIDQLVNSKWESFLVEKPTEEWINYEGGLLTNWWTVNEKFEKLTR